MMISLRETYEWLFTDLADPRVKEWPLMSGPIPGMFILTLYLYIVKVWLPDWMKNRKPYDLKKVINLYNVFQVVANYILFRGLLNAGWLTTIHWGCALPDYSNNPEAMRMAFWMWSTVMLKLIELVETTFFILRKKNKQASFLHVYHHMITPTVMWLSVKYTAGGMASLTPLINSFVHIIMYSYYLLSSMAGPDLKRKVNKWKIFMTIIQMIQFTVLMIHCLQALKPSCKIPMIMFWIYFPNLMCVYYLFWKFFKNTYMKKLKKQ